MAEIQARIRLRSDSATNWASVNPILSIGEAGFETDTKRLRIGDGSNPFTALPYFYLSTDFNLSSFMPKETSGFSGNLNSLTGQKMVQIGASVTNGWSGIAVGDVVLHWEIDASNAIQFGMAAASSAFSAWHRAKVAGAWGAWHKPVDNGATETIAGDKTFSGSTAITGLANLSGGASVTSGVTTISVSDGTKSSGTYTPSTTGGNLRHIINGGAFTFAAPIDSGDYTMVVQITNNASAGAITMSGFTKVYGDAFTTTIGDDFFVFITKVNGFTSAVVQDLQ